MKKGDSKEEVMLRKRFIMKNEKYLVRIPQKEYSDKE